MSEERKYLTDVGMEGLPFPIMVASREDPEGQKTIANISINARIMHEFEARWIDKFIQVLHSHRDRIGTQTLSANILDYAQELEASSVKVDFDYPFFIEKTTPVSGEKCLVRYFCNYSAKTGAVGEPKARFRIQVPVITTYPASSPQRPGGLFGQISNVLVEVESSKNIYPEDVVETVDRHALVPVYSFLTEEDQVEVIKKIHSEKKDSVVMTDGIKNELAHDRDVEWYSVKTSNYGMLHSYSTVIGTEKSFWVPYSSFE